MNYDEWHQTVHWKWSFSGLDRTNIIFSWYFDYSWEFRLMTCRARVISWDQLCKLLCFSCFSQGHRELGVYVVKDKHLHDHKCAWRLFCVLKSFTSGCASNHCSLSFGDRLTLRLPSVCPLSGEPCCWACVWDWHLPRGRSWGRMADAWRTTQVDGCHVSSCLGL